MPKRILVVRHGTTFREPASDPNPNLDWKVSKPYILGLAGPLVGQGIKRIYSSMTSRAWGTALVLAHILGVEEIVQAEAITMLYGVHLSYSELQKKAWPWLEEIMGQMVDGETVLVVTHHPVRGVLLGGQRGIMGNESQLGDCMIQVEKMPILDLDFS